MQGSQQHARPPKLAREAGRPYAAVWRSECGICPCPIPPDSWAQLCWHGACLFFPAHTAQALELMALLADRVCLMDRSSTARSPCSMALRRRRPKLAGDQAWPGAWGLCQYAAGDCCQLVAGGGAAAPAAICCCVMPAQPECLPLSLLPLVLLTSACLNASFQHWQSMTPPGQQS